MQFNKAFYEKHGIKITEEPIGRNKNAEQMALEQKLHTAIATTFVTTKTVEAVEKAVEKYPDSEALKNYQYIVYMKTRQPEKAFDCLINTVKKHPNYAFGLINLVCHYIDEEDINRASELLTEPYDVRRVEKEEFIHHSVFISYYQTVVRLELAKGDVKTAEQYHRMMFDYDPKHSIVQSLAGEILIGRMGSMQKRMIASSVRSVKATEKAILGWETNNEPPVFNHLEVQQLYRIDPNDMPESVIRQLLALPRETFIQDLENVLGDLIRRRQHHMHDEAWDAKTMSFVYHALYFLTELRTYDSLPTILNILRQDEKFLDYWFSDALNDYFVPTIYLLGNNQLPLLKAFVLENNNYHWSRGIMMETAAQIALRQPERRAEIVSFFKDIIETHLAQPKNNGLIDSMFLGSMLNDMLNFESVELEQEIITLFQTGWISDGECGNLEEVLAELHQPEDPNFSRISPLPASIFERYTGKYSDKVERKAMANQTKMTPEDPYNDFLMKYTLGRMLERHDKTLNKYVEDDDYYAPPQETVRRVEPKIGRNDPCHCGSGKKYKKCHGA
jgi:tetratricopeptide (TPR) repeat protein